MNSEKRLRTRIGLAIRAVGTAARDRVVGAVATIRRRLNRDPAKTSTVAQPVQSDPKIQHEHSLEHGAEGREWSAGHAKKPHVPTAVEGNGVRNKAMRRSARHA